MLRTILYKSWKKQDFAREVKMTSWVMLFYGPLDMEVPVVVDQQELIYISSVQTQEVETGRK